MARFPQPPAFTVLSSISCADILLARQSKSNAARACNCGNHVPSPHEVDSRSPIVRHARFFIYAPHAFLLPTSEGGGQGRTLPAAVGRGHNGCDPYNPWRFPIPGTTRPVCGSVPDDMRCKHLFEGDSSIRTLKKAPKQEQHCLLLFGHSRETADLRIAFKDYSGGRLMDIGVCCPMVTSKDWTRCPRFEPGE